jgi:sugar porter (SP) family MFS transporter
MDPTKKERLAKRRVVLTASVAAMGGLLFGYDTGVIGSAMLFIKDDFGLGSFEQGLVVGAVPVGAIFGAIGSGAFSDRFGRRLTILTAAFIFIGGTIVAAIAPSTAVLTLARVAIGVAIGFASAVCPVYISEVAPKDLRGRLVTLFQLAVTVGILLAYIVGLALSPSEEWRWMIGIGTLPAVLLAIGMFRMPQSPRWLVMIGEGDQARATLRYLQPQDEKVQIEDELEEIRASIMMKSGSYRDLLSPLAKSAVFIGVMLAILQQVTGINTVIYYAPTIFKLAGVGSDASAILAGAAVTAVNVAATVWALRLVRGYGRRTLLMIGVTGMTISLVALSAAFQFDAGTASSVVAIGSLMAFVTSFAISLGPIFWILNSELYPQLVRAKAAGIGSMTNWTFNFIVSLTFLLLIDALGTSGTFLLYAGIGVLTVLFVHRFVPETKDQTLEEIENGWRDKAGLEPVEVPQAKPAAS